MNSLLRGSAMASRLRGAAPSGTWQLFAGLTLLLLISPWFLYPLFLTKVLCFALFATAFNLLIGFGGLMSFGHAAFFGVASYIAAYCARTWGVPPELAIPLAVVGAAVLGVPIGALAIRRQGVYFSMITLALAQMVYFLCVQLPFTGGEDGIQGGVRLPFLGLFELNNDWGSYYFCAVVFLAGTWFARRVVHSPFGQVIQAIRDNEPRAISLGYNVYRYKLTLFVLSAGLSGLAGGLKATLFQVASLPDVHWSMSGEVLLISLIGGVGTQLGPLVGAFVVIAIEHYLAPFGSLVTITQGVAFIAVVVLFPKGIVGSWGSRVPRLFRSRAQAAVHSPPPKQD